MEFHQSSAERFAERLFNHLSKHFDGKIMNSEEFTIDLMIKSTPYEIDEDDIIDISPVPQPSLSHGWIYSCGTYDDWVSPNVQSKLSRKEATFSAVVACCGVDISIYTYYSSYSIFINYSTYWYQA